MRKYTDVLVVASLLSLGLAEPGRTPAEVEGLKVEVVDSKGIEHKLESLTCEGDPEIRLKKGTLKYRIPIRSIERLEILRGEGGVRVKVVTRGGEEDIFEVDKNLRCSGKSGSGTVTFYIGDVRTIKISEGVRR